ncbi:MAG: hypothetical protein GY794_00440 [bacterium]|nr:hypothetical protein [bacterium]
MDNKEQQIESEADEETLNGAAGGGGSRYYRQPCIAEPLASKDKGSKVSG